MKVTLTKIMNFVKVASSAITITRLYGIFPVRDGVGKDVISL